MPTLASCIIELIWEQFAALLQDRETSHPLGCPRLRVLDRTVFEKLFQVLVFDCAYEKIAEEECSATTLRHRRDEWIGLGLAETLRKMALHAYDRMVGLELSDVAVTSCITRAPFGGEKLGRSPVDRGKRGVKRSVAVDRRGIPHRSVTAPANRHDLPLLEERTLDTMEIVGELPERVSVHLDRGYASKTTRVSLKDQGLLSEISRKGNPAPLATT